MLSLFPILFNVKSSRRNPRSGNEIRRRCYFAGRQRVVFRHPSPIPQTIGRGSMGLAEGSKAANCTVPGTNGNSNIGNLLNQDNNFNLNGNSEVHWSILSQTSIPARTGASATLSSCFIVNCFVYGAKCGDLFMIRPNYVRCSQAR